MHTILISLKKRQTIAANKRAKAFHLIVLALLITTLVKAQDSCAIQVSLITCSPGNELYSIFGHSALRIQDKNTSTDIVYNYGTFEFDDPDFYSKFVRGKLMYFLSQNYYADFIYSYSLEGRSVTEQFLNLNCEQKAALQQFVWNNMKEENRFYKYDFLFDNCTTRLRDIIDQFKEQKTTLGIVTQAQDKTFRDALHDYLNRGKMHWSKLGIDLLLGIPADKKMSNKEAMFLPEYLETGVNNTKGLVAFTQHPVPKQTAGIQTESVLTNPLFIFSVLLLFILIASFSKNTTLLNTLSIFDNIYFTSLGILGCILLFMWFGSDHQQMRNNLNIAWAFPTHILWIFIKNKKAFFPKYIKLYLTISSLVLILWVFLPQQLNVSLIPIIGLAAFRSWKNINGNDSATVRTKVNTA